VSVVGRDSRVAFQQSNRIAMKARRAKRRRWRFCRCSQKPRYKTKTFERFIIVCFYTRLGRRGRLDNGSLAKNTGRKVNRKDKAAVFSRESDDGKGKRGRCVEERRLLFLPLFRNCFTGRGDISGKGRALI